MGLICNIGAFIGAFVTLIFALRIAKLLQSKSFYALTLALVISAVVRFLIIFSINIETLASVMVIFHIILAIWMIGVYRALQNILGHK